MKYKNKFFFSVLVAFVSAVCMTAEAEVVSAPDVVYYLPSTQIELKIVYEYQSYTPGMFAQYAQRYLGAENISTLEKRTYKLLDISIGQKSVADVSKPYVISADDKFWQKNTIQLTADGRLRSVNGAEVSVVTNADIKPAKCDKCKHSNVAKPNLLVPFLEEQMHASSVSKMAENTAKQIYRIREARLNLLAGDVEHVPADGDALKLTLQTLDEQEAALTELFVGKLERKRMVKTIIIDPTADMDSQILFRFSQHTGVVDSDDLSGEPVMISLKSTPAVQPALADTKKNAAPSPICYLVAGRAMVSIMYKDNELASAQMPVAQFGYVTNLPQTLFEKRSARVELDTQTGGVVSLVP